MKGKLLAPLCKLPEGVKSRTHTAAQEEGPLSSPFSNEIQVKAFGTQDMSLLLPFQEVTVDEGISLCRTKTREA